jgi:hypothetical protein
VPEQHAQGLFAGAGADEVLAERLEDRFERDEVLLVVVDQQNVHLRSDAHLPTGVFSHNLER